MGTPKKFKNYLRKFLPKYFKKVLDNAPQKVFENKPEMVNAPEGPNHPTIAKTASQSPQVYLHI